MNDVTNFTTHPVLILDDEPGVLNALRRELQTPPLGHYRYEVETFTDPSAALKRAQDREFHAVVTDYRMRQMNGLQFLKEFGNRQPDCIRIVLSGQTDFEALVRMINETHIYRFIPKPWSSYFLKSSLSQAVALRKEMLENRKLAGLLHDHGIDLPADATNPVDHILVVDDELNVAHAVERSLMRRSPLDDVFREVREETHAQAAVLNSAQISVQVTDSPLHGLKMAEEVSFSCVIADYQMPIMDGAQFLAAFSEKQPDCACVMLSGVVNLEGVVTALDLAHLHAYISKPWVDHELRAAVAQALARRRLILGNRILAQMCKARDLGVLD